jgi:hypothetical protein
VWQVYAKTQDVLHATCIPESMLQVLSSTTSDKCTCPLASMQVVGDRYANMAATSYHYYKAAP